MQLVIMSDNHGNRKALENVLEYYCNSSQTLFVHCGDSELLYHDELFGDSIRVRGNCDDDWTYPMVEQFEVAGISFLVTHGHQQLVNTGRSKLASFAKAQQAQIVLYGHTHQLFEETMEGILCINPGSVAFPRGTFYNCPSYAVLTIHSQNEIQLTYYDMNHHMIEGLNYRYHRNAQRGFIHD